MFTQRGFTQRGLPNGGGLLKGGFIQGEVTKERDLFRGANVGVGTEKEEKVKTCIERSCRGLGGCSKVLISDRPPLVRSSCKLHLCV